jgi:hypothetical protein
MDAVRRNRHDFRKSVSRWRLSDARRCCNIVFGSDTMVCRRPTQHRCRTPLIAYQSGCGSHLGVRTGPSRSRNAATANNNTSLFGDASSCTPTGNVPSRSMGTASTGQSSAASGWVKRPRLGPVGCASPSIVSVRIHPRTPWYPKVLVAGIVAYAFSPIDLIPGFVPVLGYMGRSDLHPHRHWRRSQNDTALGDDRMSRQRSGSDQGREVSKPDRSSRHHRHLDHSRSSGHPMELRVDFNLTHRRTLRPRAASRRLTSGRTSTSQTPGRPPPIEEISRVVVPESIREQRVQCRPTFRIVGSAKTALWRALRELRPIAS